MNQVTDKAVSAVISAIVSALIFVGGLQKDLDWLKTYMRDLTHRLEVVEGRYFGEKP